MIDSMGFVNNTVCTTRRISYLTQTTHLTIVWIRIPVSKTIACKQVMMCRIASWIRNKGLIIFAIVISKMVLGIRQPEWKGIKFIIGETIVLTDPG